LSAVLICVKRNLYNCQGYAVGCYCISIAVSDCAVKGVCSGCSFCNYQNHVGFARHQDAVLVPLYFVGPTATCGLCEEVPCLPRYDCDAGEG